MKSNQKGITLVSLVVTIVIIIILAGITISITVGEEGIITRANEAGKKQQIAEYKEKIELARIGSASLNYGEIKLEDIIDQLSNNQIVQSDKSNVTEIEPGKVKIITKEGYIFIVTSQSTEYAGQGEIQAPPDLQQGDVTFTIEPSKWTKGSVRVSIVANKTEEFKLQYSFDATNWNNYTGTIEVAQNTTIYACLKNAVGIQGNHATADVTNIDKLAPKNFTPTITTTTNSITVVAIAQDQEATSHNGCSGIKGYSFKINDEAWTNVQESGSYTFNNLTQNTSYTVQVKAIDDVDKVEGNLNISGNETVSKVQAVTTDGVPGIQTGDVTFTYSETNWTNKDVTITISGNNTGYILQYKTEKTGASGEVSDWTNYDEETGITLTRNQDIYARVVDSTGQAAQSKVATATVSNIDKTAPATPTITNPTNGNWTNGDINITVESTDSGAGIKKIEYSYDQSEWKSDWSGPLTINGNKGTVIGRWSAERNQQVYMRAVDNAGNPSGISSTYIRIDKTPPNTLEPTITTTKNSITIVATTTDKISNNVSSGIAGYRFSKDNGTSFSDWQLGETYTFSSLSVGTTYNIVIEVKDNANNIQKVSKSVDTKPLLYYIYNKGNAYSSITGGWRGVNINSNYTAAGTEFKVEQDYMYMRNNYGASYSIATVNKIRIPDEYTKICISIKGENSNLSAIRIGGSDAELPSLNDGYTIYAETKTIGTSDYVTISASITDIVGTNKYLYIRDDNPVAGIYINAVWFE